MKKIIDEYIFTNKIKFKLIWDLITWSIGSLILSVVFVTVLFPIFLALKIIDKDFILNNSKFSLSLVLYFTSFIFSILAFIFVKQFFQNTYLVINQNGILYVQNNEIKFQYDWKDIKGVRRVIARRGFYDIIELKDGVTPPKYPCNKNIIPHRVLAFNGNKILGIVKELSKKYQLDIDTAERRGYKNPNW